MDTAPDVQRTIQRVVSRLIQGYRPQQIILFGSLACGNPDQDSDIDMLIVKDTDESPLERRVRVRQLVFEPERRIPFSPLVLTPGELAQRLALDDPFYQEIIARGKVLYTHA
jgi:predicted nucleotidyltransferase